MSSLPPELRETIQQGYRDFLKHNGLGPRLGQKQMIAAIANDLSKIETSPEGERINDAGISVIEAGTGTGKTLSYLLAVIPFAEKLGKKIIISTGTVALQEQLVEKDIPALLESTGWPLDVVIAKGRSRYLCPVRLDQCLETSVSRDQGLFLFDDEVSFNPTDENIAIYKAMFSASEAGEWDGVRDNWPDLIEVSAWQPLTVDRRQCTSRRCRHYQKCPFYQARDHLEDADCIVVNHDLVLADLALGGGVILPPPEDVIYVLDEAHRLPETTLAHFSASSQLEGSHRQFAKMQQLLKKMQKVFAEDDLCTELISKTLIAAKSSEEALGLVVPQCRALAEQQSVGLADDRHRFRGGKIDASLQEISIVCTGKVGLLVSRLTALQEQFGKMVQQQNPVIAIEDVEPCYQQVGVWSGQAENAMALWLLYAQEVDLSGPPIARWLSLVDGAMGLDIQLSAAPTHPGEMLRQRLYDRCFALIMTSATFRALGKFDDFVYRAGLPSWVQCHSVAGVFDHFNAATLSVPNIGADGSNPEKHTAAIVAQLPDIIKLEAGTLVLFSSRVQMESVFELLEFSWQDHVLMQSKMPNKVLLSTHKERIDSGEPSIIFGLASFAEGVDLPGDYCRHVVIAKLPFSVPDDPIHGTVSDWMEENGRNSFMELMLPQASLKLNQACGRLLRTEQDTGSITILDRRIVSKRYGKKLLDGLPPYRQEIV